MRFTVLTATYNRAHTLPCLYQSLCAQTFHDFEWLIVDDGSTDGTRELVQSWRSSFPIRYLWKSNGGKHTAINAGAQQARGEFIFILDSDDRCPPPALERLDFHWRQIPQPERFAFLTGLCCGEDGAVLGTHFAQEHVDAFSLREVIKVTDGERAGIIRTNVLRQFPYPAFKNERYMLDNVVWNRVLKEYGIRFFNEPVRVMGHAADAWAKSKRDPRRHSPKGALIYHAELAFSDVPFGIRLKAGLNALRFMAIAAARDLRLIS